MLLGEGEPPGQGVEAARAQGSHTSSPGANGKEPGLRGSRGSSLGDMELQIGRLPPSPSSLHPALLHSPLPEAWELSTFASSFVY